jgi:DNA-binding MarR family transcriptional regulator
MTRPEPFEDLGIADALAQLSFLVQATLARRAGVQDLSMIQVRLLGVLRDREPTMNQIASLLGLDKSSVTGLVARAEHRGLVERSAGATDRRTVTVRLTAEGSALAQELERDVQARLGGIIDRMSARAQGDLVDLVDSAVPHPAAGALDD